MKRKKPAEKNKTRPEKTKKALPKSSAKRSGTKAAPLPKNGAFQALKNFLRKISEKY